MDPLPITLVCLPLKIFKCMVASMYGRRGSELKVLIEAHSRRLLWIPSAQIHQCFFPLCSYVCSPPDFVVLRLRPFATAGLQPTHELPRPSSCFIIPLVYEPDASFSQFQSPLLESCAKDASPKISGCDSEIAHTF